jgi:hypothetical protein
LFTKGCGFEPHERRSFCFLDVFWPIGQSLLASVQNCALVDEELSGVGGTQYDSEVLAARRTIVLSFSVGRSSCIFVAEIWDKADERPHLQIYN